MQHLQDIGLLERNPGHGHPLRPEFRLTAQGHLAAQMANSIICAAKGEGCDLLRRSWTLPVLASLRRPSHFSAIKRRLVTISDRALSQSLHQMEGQCWVQRHVDTAARPPRPVYCAVNTGAEISGAASHLSQNMEELPSASLPRLDAARQIP